jgi:hypothetical protein
LAWSALLGATTVEAQQPGWMQNGGSAPRGAYYAGVARGAAGYAPTGYGRPSDGQPGYGQPGAATTMMPGAQAGGAWSQPSSPPVIPGATIPPSLAATMPGSQPVSPASYLAPAAAGYAPQPAPAYAPSTVNVPSQAYAAQPVSAPATVSPAGPQWNMQGTMTTVRPSVAQILSASRTAPSVPQQTHGVRPAAFAGPSLGSPTAGAPMMNPPPAAAPTVAPVAAQPLTFPGRATPQAGAMHRAVGPYGQPPLMAQVPQPMSTGVMPGPAPAATPGFSGGEFGGPVTGYETLPGSVMQRSTSAPNAGPAPYAAPNSWNGGAAPMPDAMSSGYGGMAPYAGASAEPLYDPGMVDGGYGGFGGSNPCDPGVMGGSCGPWFVSLGGLVMTRDVPNNVGLAFVGADPEISVLNTEQAGFDWVGGWEGRVGRSIGQQWAIEAVYWGLQPMDTQISVRGADNINSRLDFGTQAFEGTLMADYFNNSREQRVRRVNEFHNIEVNLLQTAMMVDPNGRFGMTFFSGARYFRYREDFDYLGVMAGAEFFQNDFNTQAGYHIQAHNHLIGWQIGSRGHLFLGEKFRLYAVPRVGVFANNISQYQELCMVINMHSRKVDVAFLGQLDVGASYQLFRCCSIYAGYRAMGIAGVANADDNIPISFMSQPDMAQINSSGSIILHGANAGIQFQF